jgi:peptidoglycan/LPS O-acetylase OafA/YrhL
MQTKRFKSLDALRGIAATVVLLHHLLLSVPGIPELLWIDPTANRRLTSDWQNVLAYSPIHIFWSGHEAVLLFFLLSGFVLTLALEATRDGYLQYALKRFIRIWIPFAVAVLSAFAILAATNGNNVQQGYSSWLQAADIPLPSAKILLGHLLMTGLSYHSELDAVIWSLVHEVRISLLMPLIVWLLMHRRRHAIALAAACLIVPMIYSGAASTGAKSMIGSLLQTASYVPLFIGGSWLALNRHLAITWVHSRSKLAIMILWSAAIILVLCRYLIWEARFPSFLISSAGAAIAMTLSFSAPTTIRLLLARPLLWIGKISYSIYLVHLPIMLLVSKFIPASGFGLPVSLVMMLIICIAAGFLFHRFVETPAQKLAHLPQLSDVGGRLQRLSRTLRRVGAELCAVLRLRN